MTNRDLVFKFVGHACVLATYQGQSILFDPWLGSLISGGAVGGYPAFSKLSQAELDSLVGIHISHIHHDHCCVSDLATLPKNVPVYIGDYLKSDFRSILERVGFERVVTVPTDVQGVDIGPFRLSIFPKNPEDGSFDSSAVLSAGEKRVYLSNDCIHPDSFYFLLKKVYGDFEGAFVGFASVNPYIWNSDYSHCVDVPRKFSLDEFIDQRQETAWQHSAKIAKLLSARWAVPYASSYKFMTKDLAHLNKGFASPTEIRRFDLGTARAVCLEHGESLDTSLPTEQLEGSAQGPTLVPPELLSPSRFDRPHSQADLNRLARDVEPIFLGVFRRQEKRWKLPMTIRIRIAAESGESFLYYEYDGKRVEARSSAEPDVEMSFQSGLIEDLVSGELDMVQVYSTFAVRNTWYRLKIGQMLFTQWV